MEVFRPLVGGGMEFVMMEQLRTVYQGGVGEIVEKKSRFIATVRLVESEEEALEVLEAARKKYWDATHNCFAYVIGERRKRSGAVTMGNRRERRDVRCWMCCWEKRSRM